jgi:hypothetical protein
MSGVSVDVAAVAVVTTGGAEAAPVPGRRAGWWRAWRDRFGLAEVCGTLAAVPGGVWLGFAVGKAVADVAWYGLEASARRSVRIVRQGVIARPVRDHEKNPA